MPSSNPPITGSGISAVTVSGSPVQVFYQFSDGYAGESIFNTGGGWSQDELQISPGYSSPMASVSWDNQGEIRIYYLDAAGVIQEYCYTSGTGWYVGDLGGSVYEANPKAGLAAVTWADPNMDVQDIRVYYQAAENDDVLELTFSGSWSPGSLTITNALSTTNLAAVTYYSDGQQQINLYYQAEDLSLGEYVNDGSGWSEGNSNPGKAVAQTPLSAIVLNNAVAQVYWRDSVGNTVHSTNAGSWSSPSNIPAIKAGYGFAALQWGNGKHLRFYFQDSGGVIRELNSNNNGSSWVTGELTVD